MQTKKAKYEYHKQWAQRNPDKIAKHQEKRRLKEKADPNFKDRKFNALLLRKYKISLSDRENMFNEQQGKCALCYQPEGKFKLHVDHNHQTGKVRGLLCHQCNWYLGKIDKDPLLLNRIEKYRKKGE
jgi:hypothetical protein